MKSAIRPSRSEAELKDAAQHVSYEVNMFCFIPEDCPSMVGSPSIDERKDMALESFLVHYRNVRDFLFPRKSIKEPDPQSKFYPQALDTVLAVDFDQSWQKEAKDWTCIVPNEGDRINKRLAHISYSRSGYDPNWPLEEMKNELEKQFKKFLRGLPPARKQYFSQLSRLFPEELS